MSDITNPCRRAAALHREVSDTADKLKRLYRMVEDGVAELDDILRDRIASLKIDRERAQTALDRIRVQTAPPEIISPETVEQFGRIMRENIANGGNSIPEGLSPGRDRSN